MKAQLLGREATIRTAAVSIQALTVEGKQVTMGLFRQLLIEPIISQDTGDLTPGVVLWGKVNYFPAPCDPDHLHVVWQKGEELRRACVQNYRELGDQKDQRKADLLSQTIFQLLQVAAYYEVVAGTVQIIEKYEETRWYHLQLSCGLQCESTESHMYHQLVCLLTDPSVYCTYGTEAERTQRVAEERSRARESLLNRAGALQCYLGFNQQARLPEIIDKLRDLLADSKLLRSAQDSANKRYLESYQKCLELPQLFIAV